ncbi:hypothetical protein [Nicoliella lavandulae]|uniref:DUF2634 domain-containing protein n=1 Tax=Nicoliella lavandulae TaxID=3082954 RepID=A0ABU8SMC4_9LACO
MSKYAFALDDDGDIKYNEDTGTFDMVSADDEVTQYLYLLLGTNLGELTWNEDIGLPQQQLILMGDDEMAVQSMISNYLEEMLGTQFVDLDITHFEVDNENRLTNLQCSVTMNTEDGELTLDTAISNDSERGGA